MKIGIVGGNGHYRYCLDEVSRVGSVAIAPGTEGEDLTKLENALAKRNITVTRYEDYRTLLDSVDVVVVNTRFDRNATVTEECLRRDRFVFSEKPLATTVRQLSHLKETAAASRAFVVGMFGIRYAPWYRTVKAALGRVGRIRLVNAQKSYRLGTRNEYYHRQETFGGLIPWVSIHAMDWITDLTEKKVLSVTALTNNAENKGNGDLEMTALCQMELEDGVLASVTADFFRPAGAPTHDDDRVRVVGTKGILEYQNGLVTLTDADGLQTLPLLPGEDVFSLFLRRIAGEPVGVTPEESFAVTELALLAEEAARAGKK